MSPRLVRVLVLQLFAAVTVFSTVAEAQRPHARIGSGTLLTRDRGWNYHESIEFFATVGQSIAFADVEVGASVIKSFAGEMGRPANFTGPVAFRDGLGARLHVRFPSATRSPLSALAGGEVIQDRTGDNERTTSAGSMVGAGWNFGPQRRGSLDLRYVAFGNRLGSSRGILALTLGLRP